MNKGNIHALILHSTPVVIDESQFGPQKDPALEKLKPDKTFYLAFDDYSVKNPHYHHDKFYPIDTMALISKDTKTHQINHVSLQVKMLDIRLYIYIYI